MSEKYAHWKNLMERPYIGAYSLAPGEERVLTIKEVKKEKVVTSGGKSEICPVAYFAENSLPMVLNATNCKTIAKLYGSDNVYDWANKKIQLFATSTQFGRDTVPCLRIRPFAPAGNEVEYKCSVCNKAITESVYKGSIAKYGKAYCSAECKDLDVKGKDVLE